jgi:hypothetical protein
VSSGGSSQGRARHETTPQAGWGTGASGNATWEPVELRLSTAARRGDRGTVLSQRPLRAGQVVSCVFDDGMRQTCRGTVDSCVVQSIGPQGLTYEIGVVFEDGDVMGRSAPAREASALPSEAAAPDAEAGWPDDLPDFEVLFDEIEDADD